MICYCFQALICIYIQQEHVKGVKDRRTYNGELLVYTIIKICATAHVYVFQFFYKMCHSLVQNVSSMNIVVQYSTHGSMLRHTTKCNAYQVKFVIYFLGCWQFFHSCFRQ